VKAKRDPATARQSEYLAAIVALTRELGRAPSAVAISERLGVSRTGVRPQLRALEKKGLIRDVPKEVRSGKWKLTRAARALLGEAGPAEPGDE
jgi:Mn-dependent DtxR family transcriptional regulator